MFQRLIKNDLKENKVSMLVIGLFLLLTLTLSFAATRLTVSLTSSIERFVETAKSPHLLQMHSGSVDRERLQKLRPTVSGNCLLAADRLCQRGRVSHPHQWAGLASGQLSG